MTIQDHAVLQDLTSMDQAFHMHLNNLGHDLLDAALAGIRQHCDAQVDPDGNPWEDLAEYTKGTKLLTVGFIYPIGVQYGLMLSDIELRGEREIDPNEAQMSYGVTTEARIEAHKFSRGGEVTGTNQPPREFYALTPSAIAAADDILARRFEFATTPRN